MADMYKDKYINLKENVKNEKFMDQARSVISRGTSEDEHNQNNDISTMYGSVRSGVQEKAGSVVSGVSGLAQHAKTIVSQMNNFNCSTLNERNNESVIDDDTYDEEEEDDGVPEINDKTNGSSNRKYRPAPMTQRSQDSNTTSSTNTSAANHEQMDRSRSRTKQSRSFRDYSKSPKRVDV